MCFCTWFFKADSSSLWFPGDPGAERGLDMVRARGMIDPGGEGEVHPTRRRAEKAGANKFWFNCWGCGLVSGSLCHHNLNCPHWQPCVLQASPRTEMMSPQMLRVPLVQSSCVHLHWIGSAKFHFWNGSACYGWVCVSQGKWMDQQVLNIHMPLFLGEVLDSRPVPQVALARTKKNRSNVFPRTLSVICHSFADVVSPCQLFKWGWSQKPASCFAQHTLCWLFICLLEPSCATTMPTITMQEGPVALPGMVGCSQVQCCCQGLPDRWTGGHVLLAMCWIAPLLEAQGFQGIQQRWTVPHLNYKFSMVFIVN